jgi:hypothetical protein
MSSNQLGRTIAIALISGVSGGIGSSLFLVGTPVLAERTAQETKIIRAEKFEVVDKDGRVHGELGLRHDGVPVLRLYDEDGNPRVGFSPKGDEGGVWSGR